jgi:hypothetical protein
MSTLWGEMAKRLQCHICHSGFPNLHLLDLHMSEVHDAFFDAQVQRGLPVYQCLVEYCGKSFCTIEERRQHLIRDHLFSPDMHLEEMHLLTHKARRKVSSVSSSMDVDACQDDLSRLKIRSVPLQTSKRRERLGPDGRKKTRHHE